LKNGKDLLKTMLLICTKELTIKDLSRIYIRIDNIETMLKEAVYDIDLTNYLYNAIGGYSAASLGIGDFTSMGTAGNLMHIWGPKAGFGG
jgi:hypothetical protein